MWSHRPYNTSDDGWYQHSCLLSRMKVAFLTAELVPPRRVFLKNCQHHTSLPAVKDEGRFLDSRTGPSWDPGVPKQLFL